MAWRRERHLQLRRELGDYATYKVDGITNSKQAADGLAMYKELYKFTPPGWGKTFFVEDNQAITGGLTAMSMNFFAFFPPLVNKATKPQRCRDRFLRQSGGPNGQRFAALGGQGISVVSYSKNQEASMKFLNGSSRTRPRRSGRPLAATPAARRC